MGGCRALPAAPQQLLPHRWATKPQEQSCGLGSGDRGGSCPLGRPAALGEPGPRTGLRGCRGAAGCSQPWVLPTAMGHTPGCPHPAGQRRSRNFLSSIALKGSEEGKRRQSHSRGTAPHSPTGEPVAGQGHRQPLPGRGCNSTTRQPPSYHPAFPAPQARSLQPGEISLPGGISERRQLFPLKPGELQRKAELSTPRLRQRTLTHPGSPAQSRQPQQTAQEGGFVAGAGGTELSRDTGKGPWEGLARLGWVGMGRGQSCPPSARESAFQASLGGLYPQRAITRVGLYPRHSQGAANTFPQLHDGSCVCWELAGRANGRTSPPLSPCIQARLPPPTSRTW